MRNVITHFFGLLFAVALSSCANAEPLSVGSAVPAVKCSDQDGKEVDLAKAAGEGWALVYFYPRADTPGCTKQACSLRDAYAEIGDLGVKVFGVSNDSVAAQKAFAEKYRLPFTLLADEPGAVIKAFGVSTIVSGMASRQAFLFRDGKLVWHDAKASTAKQAADVIEQVKALK